jgi:gliding motility-associated-like protein
VEAPNVFTPNNDNDNDEFFLTSKNLTSLNLVIVNRWGLVVFDKLSTDLVNDNPSWDGKVGQNTANEGVYFYKYTAIGINGQELVGHGFLHLYN